MFNVVRHPCHVGKKGCSGQDDGIVANEGAEDEEKDVEVEKQLMADAASPFEHLESQISDETGSIYGDGNVCKRYEEGHDVDGRDVVGAYGTMVHFVPSNCPHG